MALETDGKAIAFGFRCERKYSPTLHQPIDAQFFEFSAIIRAYIKFSTFMILLLLLVLLLPSPIKESLHCSYYIYVFTFNNIKPTDNNYITMNRTQGLPNEIDLTKEDDEDPDYAIVFENIEFNNSNVSDHAQIVREVCVREPVVYLERPIILNSVDDISIRIRPNTRSRLRNNTQTNRNSTVVSDDSDTTINQSTSTNNSSSGCLETPPSSQSKKRKTTPTTTNLDNECMSPPIHIQCKICLTSVSTIEKEGKTKIVASRCGHIFCESCLNQALQVSGKVCPTCRKPLKGKQPYHQIFLD